MENVYVHVKLLEHNKHSINFRFVSVRIFWDTVNLLGHGLIIWDLAFITQVWRSVLSGMSFPTLLSV